MKMKGAFAVRWAPTDGTGVTIIDKWVKYCETTTNVKPTSGWSTTMPEPDDGNYLWTWTHMEYSDGNSTDAYSVARQGVDGRGIVSSSVDYSMQPGPTDPTYISAWGNFPMELTDGWWLYTRTIVYYTGDESATSYSVAQIGTGSYYAGVREFYKAGKSATTVPAGAIAQGTYTSGTLPSTTWKEQRPTLNTSTPYLWNFEISADSRGNMYVTDARCIGNFSKGIVSIVKTYAISAQKVAPTGRSYPSDIVEADWTDEHQMAEPTEAKPYQWSKTQTTYNNGDKDYHYGLSAIRGLDGTGATYLDLDNENDSMIYDGSGNRVSEIISSAIRLYNNGVDITTSFLNSGGTFVKETETGLTSSIYRNSLTVSDVSSSDGFVIIKAVFKNVAYYTRFTCSRLTGIDKYELVCTPSSLTYNSTTEEGDSTVKVQVYKTPQNGTRQLLPTLPSGFSLMTFWGQTVAEIGFLYANGKCTFNADLEQDNYRIELRNASNIMLDYETIPICHVADGGRGVGIKSANVLYGVSNSGTTAPADSVFVADDLNTLLTETNNSSNPCVWSATKIVDDDNKVSFSGKMYVGKINEILEGLEVYAQSSSGSSCSGVTWYSATLFNSMTKKKGYYIWTATRIKYVGNTGYSYVGATCVGYTGKDGDGVTILSQEVKYAQSTSGTSHENLTWVETIPEVTTGNFLWTWVHINYSDGSSTDSYSVSKQGMNGCIMRTTEWAEGQQYRNDSSLVAENRFLDIVVVSVTATTFERYMCKETHTSTESGATAKPTATNSYWTKLDNSFPIYTPLIMADYAMLRFAQTNQLVVSDANGNVCTGLKGGAGDSVNIFAGSSTPANAPFRVMEDGSFFSKNATIDGKMVGSVRNPVTEPKDGFDVNYSDNVALASNEGSFVFGYNIPWDISQSGRILRLTNYKVSSGESTGAVSFSAESGKFFYEDGIAKNSLNLSREMVELFGYGTANIFYGWIVVKRINLMTTHCYGRDLRCLAMGVVTGTTTNASISASTFDGSTLSVSRLSVGTFQINFPDKWNVEPENMLCMATGMRGCANELLKATIMEIGSNYIVIKTADDNTVNDGSFQFMLFNKADFV